MSLAPELVERIFRELINKEFILELKRRSNPLVSDYVIKYGSDCSGVTNLNEDLALEREWNWYEILSLGVGSKLSLNRIMLSISPLSNAINLTFKLMGGDRLKSTEDIPIICTDNPAQDVYVYGKSILDLLINSDVVERAINTVKERKKITNGFIDGLIKRIKDMRSSIDQDLRRLVNVYSWFEV